MRSFGWLLIAALLVAAGGPRAQAPDFAVERRAMVREIELNALGLAPVTGVSVLDARVLAAFATVARHRFVPERLGELAYADTPLPLGHGQSLSQPFLAALMTHVLAIKPGDRVLETGTDTGYQAAILAALGARVYSVEIVEPLHEIARHLLDGEQAIALKLGDGYLGWDTHAPYDAMLIKESAVALPPALVRQLKPGGRMVIPLGPPEGPQALTLVVKREDGRLLSTPLLPVRFTPFQGGTRT